MWNRKEGQLYPELNFQLGHLMTNRRHRAVLFVLVAQCSLQKTRLMGVDNLYLKSVWQAVKPHGSFLLEILRYNCCKVFLIESLPSSLSIS